MFIRGKLPYVYRVVIKKSFYHLLWIIYGKILVIINRIEFSIHIKTSDSILKRDNRTHLRRIIKMKGGKIIYKANQNFRNYKFQLILINNYEGENNEFIFRKIF